MADNTVLSAAVGTGDTIRTDDISSVKYPTSKITLGADGVDDGFVSSANPLPVTLSSVPSHAVTNAGTFPVQVNGDALTALQLIDNPVNTDGSAAGTGLFLVGGTDGTNAQIFSVTAAGLLNVADGAGSLTVDAPVGTPVHVRLSDGSAAISTLPVSLASVPSHAVTNAGTFAVQVDGAALTALQLIDNVVNVDDAAYTAASGSGVPLMGFVTSDTVDSGDVGVVGMTTARTLKTTLYNSSGTEVTAGPVSSWDHLRKDLTTTAAVLGASTSASIGITVKAADDNTDAVYIGNSDVTAGGTAATDGYPLLAGDSHFFPVNNLNLLYGISASGTQKVYVSIT